jgi:hypothetical protein
VTDRSLTDEIRELDDAIREHEKLQRRYGPGTTLVERFRQVVQHYQESSVQTALVVQQFRDDLLVQFRAFSLVVDMVGSASTHSEKSARLRGLSELIEGSIDKLRRFEINDAKLWQFPDVFRSDYPTRAYLQRIHDLEDRIRELTADQTTEPMEGLPV